MLHLALMASENRAAYLLGRTYPGGMSSFVDAMNAKAQLLGMHDTRYVEPTGLSSDNRSSAEDLARLVNAASKHPLLRELSTSPEDGGPGGPAARSSSATRTDWCATPSGTSACRRPATSPPPGAAW